MTTEERLKQYIDSDEVYQGYKNGNINLTDFEKFCIQHCKDIEEILEENQELKKQLEEKERQQEKFIKYLNWQIKSCRYTYETYGPGNINIHYAAAHEVDLDNYKKIIGGKE